MIRLYTTWYEERRADRAAEYVECLQRNVRCKSLSEIIVFDESKALRHEPGRLRVVPVQSRPTFADIISKINEDASPSDFSLIANTDIVFDDSIMMLYKVPWDGRLAFALSRWDVKLDGTCELFERKDSQDCWVFQGRVPDSIGNYPLGVYDCDNKFAWELHEAGYDVLNPSFSLRTFHYHLSGFRSYEQGVAPDYGIRSPYYYVHPDNLWGLLAARKVQKELSLAYLPWKMTGARFLRYRLPKLFARIFNKFVSSYRR